MAGSGPSGSVFLGSGSVILNVIKIDVFERTAAGGPHAGLCLHSVIIIIISLRMTQ